MQTFQTKSRSLSAEVQESLGARPWCSLPVLITAVVVCSSVLSSASVFVVLKAFAADASDLGDEDCAGAASAMDARAGQAAGACAAVTAIASAVGCLLSRAVTRPMCTITEFMKELGEYDGEELEQLERLYAGRGSRIQEVGELQTSFLRMSRGIEMFKRYVPDTVVRDIVRGDERAMRLHVSQRVVTIMFTDIANFTTIAESMKQVDLLFLLTRYFSVMTRIVEVYEGVVAEILGDGLVAFWNTPDDIEDHAAKACAAALTKQQVMETLNAELSQFNLPEISVRIGIHTGTVLSGNIGSETKMKFGCMGDAMNLTSRLEGLCKVYGVNTLCSEATRRALTCFDEKRSQHGFVVRELDIVQALTPVAPDDGEVTPAHGQRRASAEVIERIGNEALVFRLGPDVAVPDPSPRSGSNSPGRSRRPPRPVPPSYAAASCAAPAASWMEPEVAQGSPRSKDSPRCSKDSPRSKSTLESPRSALGSAGSATPRGAFAFLQAKARISGPLAAEAQALKHLASLDGEAADGTGCGSASSTFTPRFSSREQTAQLRSPLSSPRMTPPGSPRKFGDKAACGKRSISRNKIEKIERPSSCASRAAQPSGCGGSSLSPGSGALFGLQQGSPAASGSEVKLQGSVLRHLLGDEVRTIIREELEEIKTAVKELSARPAGTTNLSEDATPTRATAQGPREKGDGGFSREDIHSLEFRADTAARGKASPLAGELPDEHLLGRNKANDDDAPTRSAFVRRGAKRSLLMDSEDTFTHLGRASHRRHQLQQEEEIISALSFMCPCCIPAMQRFFVVFNKLGTGKAPPRRDMLSQFIDSSVFTSIVCLVVFLNCLFMVVAADAEVYSLSNDTEISPLVTDGEFAFLSFYSGELLLHLYRHKLTFFYNADWLFNWLDVFLLVLSAYFALLSDVVANVGWLRTLRILRLAKALRVFKLIRLFVTLRAILSSLASSLPTLLASLFLLTVIVFMFALTFVIRVASYLADLGTSADSDKVDPLKAAFGKVSTTMVVLYQCTSGGADWSEYYSLLGQTGFINQCLFLFFVAFIQIALLNIILGIFVDRVMRNMSNSKEQVARDHANTQLHHEQDLRELCYEADSNKDGRLSLDEWQEAASMGYLSSYLDLIGFRVPNVIDFFRRQQGSDGQVDIDDFVSGCLRMKGPASSFDLHIVLQEVKEMRGTILKMQKAMNVSI